MPEMGPRTRGRWEAGEKAALVWAMLAALVLSTAAPASKEGLLPRPVQAQSLDLTVTVDCESDPEATMVQNNGNTSVTIETVGSIHDPRSDEPFAVDEPLDAGGSITFESGSGGSQNVLTEQFIYDNEVGSEEGAEVITSTGERFTARCGTVQGGSGQGNRDGGAAAHQYGEDEVIVKTIPKEKKLSDTSGASLIPPAGALLLGTGLLLGRSVIRRAL